MTPRRQRFLDDQRMRNMVTGTQDHYVRAVAQFAKHFNQSPDRPDHVREYLLHLIRGGLLLFELRAIRGLREE